MADTAKVIRLEPDAQRHIRARLARLPAEVHAFNDIGKKVLAELLVAFFDAADDRLFEMADTASSHGDQNLFFDSMREVRVQRKGLEHRFIDTVQEAFARLMGDSPEDELPEFGELSVEAISLVQSEDLEQLVAMEGVLEYANKKYLHPIREVSGALSRVVNESVNAQNYPFGPEVLCVAILAQIKRLDIDIKAKLALFRLFDETVIRQLDPLYDQLAAVLFSRGGGKGPALPYASSTRADALSEIPQSENVENSLLQEALDFAQALPSQASLDGEFDVERVIRSVEQQRKIEIRLSATEREAIRLVQLMFRLILQDEALAIPLKEHLCRLQIPSLRMALADKAFLEDKRHPARKLLNDIVASSYQWTSSADISPQDPLFLLITSTVDRIALHRVASIDVFQKALADFTSYLDQDRKRSAMMERRTIDAEDGKARAEIARVKVAEAIQRELKQRELPPVVAKIIDGPWNNVLFVSGLKYGFDSIEWKAQLEVLNKLVWSVQPVKNRAEKQRLIQLIPELTENLRRGLDSISVNPFEVSELFDGLEQVHLKCIRNAGNTASESELMEDIPGTDADADAEGEGEIESTTPSIESGDADLQALDEANLVNEEGSEDDEFARRVQGFAQGAWFDLDSGVGEVTRCRLAAFIKPTGKYIFVDRGGSKVAEKTRDELAALLKVQAIRPLDHSMLFDKALESVVSGLRKSSSGVTSSLKP